MHSHGVPPSAVHSVLCAVWAVSRIERCNNTNSNVTLFFTLKCVCGVKRPPNLAAGPIAEAAAEVGVVFPARRLRQMAS